ncbi:MAG: S1 RNA-binding domain-containing protein [Oscillospiraceae bacterium]|nr:S1 RNA-binding domain-containing protein [Oscillospiraceae bacterium]
MQLEVGTILEGKVTGITKFGVFVELGEGKTGMVHISEVSSNYVTEITDHVKEGQIVKVKVLSIGEDGKIRLSMKKLNGDEPKEKSAPQKREPRQDREPRGDFGFQKKSNQPMSFEDMLTKFKQSSDEKMSDLKRNMDSKRGSGSRRGGR